MTEEKSESATVEEKKDIDEEGESSEQSDESESAGEQKFDSENEQESKTDMTNKVETMNEKNGKGSKTKHSKLFRVTDQHLYEAVKSLPQCYAVQKVVETVVKREQSKRFYCEQEKAKVKEEKTKQKDEHKKLQRQARLDSKRAKCSKPSKLNSSEHEVL